jgi:hypothetical protein
MKQMKLFTSDHKENTYKLKRYQTGWEIEYKN